MTAKYVGGSGSVVVNLQGEVVGMLTHAGSLDAATGFVDGFSYAVNLAGQTIRKKRDWGCGESLRSPSLVRDLKEGQKSIRRRLCRGTSRRRDGRQRPPRPSCG